MLSIIVCSRNKITSDLSVKNIDLTCGIDYELIHIDNSENKYSVFLANNIGVKKAKLPYLCFVHEDVLFQTKNWGKNLLAHLSSPETGIVGAADCELTTRIPASWSIYEPNTNIIQSESTSSKKIKQLSPKGFNDT